MLTFRYNVHQRSKLLILFAKVCISLSQMQALGKNVNFLHVIKLFGVTQHQNIQRVIHKKKLFCFYFFRSIFEDLLRKSQFFEGYFFAEIFWASFSFLLYHQTDFGMKNNFNYFVVLRKSVSNFNNNNKIGLLVINSCPMVSDKVNYSKRGNQTTQLSKCFHFYSQRVINNALI